MGRVAGSYGVRGWIKVERPQQGLAAARRWWIGGAEYSVAETKVHSGALLACLSGLASREAALKLRGETVFVPREALPEPEAGHYYLADLVGLEVVNGRGIVLGTVKRWLFNGAQDVMELSGEKERLLPWIPTVVRDVDLKKKQIHVDWEADW